jgi:hypothetical protein
MHTSKLASLALITLAIAQFTGCAMVKNTSASAPASPPVLDAVTINSIPSGAVVSLDGKDLGVTPQQVSLDRAHTYLLAVKQQGFCYYTQTLKVAGGASGGQSGSPTQFPAVLSISLSPVTDPFQALEVAVSKLDGQLQAHQISMDDYKQQLAEVTGLYR